MVYFGATVGSVIAVPLLDLVPTRWALLGCLLLQIIALFLFTYA